eukprot:scaffold5621_cov296-Prasinococcus_capsulatus_cf.AAC.1
MHVSQLRGELDARTQQEAAARLRSERLAEQLAQLRAQLDVQARPRSSRDAGGASVDDDTRCERCQAKEGEELRQASASSRSAAEEARVALEQVRARERRRPCQRGRASHSCCVSRLVCSPLQRDREVGRLRAQLAAKEDTTDALLVQYKLRADRLQAQLARAIQPPPPTLRRQGSLAPLAVPPAAASGSFSSPLEGVVAGATVQASGAALASAPGSSPASLEAEIDTLQERLMQRLRQKTRDAIHTGGAAGDDGLASSEVGEEHEGAVEAQQGALQQLRAAVHALDHRLLRRGERRQAAPLAAPRRGVLVDDGLHRLPPHHTSPVSTHARQRRVETAAPRAHLVLAQLMVQAQAQVDEHLARLLSQAVEHQRHLDPPQVEGARGRVVVRLRHLPRGRPRSGRVSARATSAAASAHGTHLLQAEVLRAEEAVEQLARVLDGHHGHLGDLLLLQRALEHEDAADARRERPEALLHHSLQLPHLDRLQHSVHVHPEAPLCAMQEAAAVRCNVIRERPPRTSRGAGARRPAYPRRSPRCSSTARGRADPGTWPPAPPAPAAARAAPRRVAPTFAARGSRRPSGTAARGGTRDAKPPTKARRSPGHLSGGRTSNLLRPLAAGRVPLPPWRARCHHRRRRRRAAARGRRERASHARARPRRGRASCARSRRRSPCGTAARSSRSSRATAPPPARPRPRPRPPPLRLALAPRRACARASASARAAAPLARGPAARAWRRRRRLVARPWRSRGARPGRPARGCSRSAAASPARGRSAPGRAPSA